MSDSCCGKVIVRHQGPPGEGVPDGGTTGQILVKVSDADQDTAWASVGAGMGDVVGPASSVANNLAVFTDTSGNFIGDSGLALTDVATTTQLSTKVDKITGKGLSTNDFTDALKAKLEAATAENFRGEYVSFLALTTAVPTGNPGDYANVVTVGTDLVQYVWDDTNDVWISLNAALGITGEDIADVLFNPLDSAVYDQDDCRIFTSDEKTALEGAASLEYVNALALAAGAIGPAYAALMYFNLTGTSVSIISASDGTSAMVKIDVASTIDPSSVNFDSPAQARLRYTGAETRLFVATYTVSFNGPASSEMVFGLAKNGSVSPTSKLLTGTDATPATTAISATSLISLSTNDYIEVFVGNTSNTNDPTVKVLALEISPA